MLTIFHLVLTATSTASVDPNSVAANPDAFVQLVVSAFQSRNWSLLAGLLLAAVVWAINMFVVGKVDPAHMRWVAMGLSTATSVALGLQAGEPWMNIVVTGITVGLMAVGTWETAGKTARNTIRRRRKKS